MAAWRDSTVRKHLLWASASLVLLAACGGATATTPASGSGSGASACVNSGAAHHAYLVVQHLSGSTLQGCVGFDGAEINGDDLMARSKIQYQTQTFAGIGKAVCQVDNEPAQFTECFPKDKPYWALVISTGGAAWADAQVGYDKTSLKDGDALGWQYRQANASPPPPPLPKK